MITFEKVTKVRGKRTILHEITAGAGPGRVTALVGPNGAGKSSTLRILLGLDRPTSGRATIGGTPYASLRNPLRTIGASLGGSGAHRSRRAHDHLAWVARSNGIRRSRIEDVLDAVGLADAARARVHTYSLGMAQRLGVATALLGEPEVLVLDEPVNGLDPEGIRWIRGLLREHADRGGTVLLSSHLMSEIAMIADDVLVMARGRIVAHGPLDAVASGHSDLEAAFFALTGGGQ